MLGSTECRMIAQAVQCLIVTYTMTKTEIQEQRILRKLKIARNLCGPQLNVLNGAAGPGNKQWGQPPSDHEPFEKRFELESNTG